MDRDLYLLSTPPRMTVQIYKRMRAYGNHFQVRDGDTPHLVSYDCGLISEFEQRESDDSDRAWIEMGYVGELDEIWLMNYGGISTPVILMKGAWVRGDWNGKRATMKRDSDGFLLANFRQKLPEWEEPFVFPDQVEQAFFLDVEELPGWRVVCHKEPRNRRMEGSKLTFSLDSHISFDHPRLQALRATVVSDQYVPLTRLETWQGETVFEEVADESVNPSQIA